MRKGKLGCEILLLKVLIKQFLDKEIYRKTYPIVFTDINKLN